jgi:hypothetical protein
MKISLAEFHRGAAGSRPHGAILVVSTRIAESRRPSVGSRVCAEVPNEAASQVETDLDPSAEHRDGETHSCRHIVLSTAGFASTSWIVQSGPLVLAELAARACNRDCPPRFRFPQSA